MRQMIGSKRPHPLREGRYLIVVAREFVYADESGTHGENVCLIGGYRGSPGQWKALRKEWNAILTRYQVKAFHANVFFHRRTNQNRKENPYIKWSDDKAKRFLGELVKVVRKRSVYPVGCAIHMSAWNALSYTERCYLAGYVPDKRFAKRQHRANPQPYHLAFRVTLEDVAHGTNPDIQLTYTFAEQKQYESRALECWNLIKTGPNPLPYVSQLRRVGYESPVDEPALQIADLYAWAWHRYFTRNDLNTEELMTMTALNYRRGDMLEADAAGLEAMLQGHGLTDEARQEMRAHDRLIDEGRRVLAEHGIRLDV